MLVPAVRTLETMRQFVTKLTVCIAEPAIPLLGIYPGEERNEGWTQRTLYRNVHICSAHRCPKLETPNVLRQGKGQPGSRPHDSHHRVARRNKLLMENLDGSQVHCAQQRGQCPGLSPGQVHVSDTLQRQNHGTENSGCQGMGLGGDCRSSTVESWGPGGWLTELFWVVDTQATPPHAQAAAQPSPAPFRSAPGGLHS